MISFVALAFVFVMMMVRKIGSFHFELWQIMGVGALVVLLTGELSLREAFFAINWEVMLFLMTMFLIGAAMEESGYLSHLTYEIFKRTKTIDGLVLMILFVMGGGSAFLMNDTLAIVGTPVMLHLAKKHHLKASFLLVTLAFAVTIGSVMSPLGNPQNFLIASEGHISSSVGTFLRYLAVPTLFNLFVAYGVLRVFYRDQFRRFSPLVHSQEPIHDHQMAMLARISLVVLVVGVGIKVVSSFLPGLYDIPLLGVTTLASLPPLLFGKKRKLLLQRLDWHTLLFFAAMFILMRSVWNTGYVQTWLERLPFSPTSLEMIGAISVLGSQILSNVPLVALYLPMLRASGGGIREMMILAAGSTIAGNLTLLGAASNVIILQNAEKRARETVSFWEFFRIGLPLTVFNLFVYALFLR
ncbi:MAG: SLC13 family permease [Brevinematales bacterium]|nr:SLC13 family permease [Brevinematales bacterium]